MKTQLMMKNKRRFCDADLKSVIIKLKNKIKESINKFKALPKEEKIIRILSDVLLILGSIATATDIHFLKQELNELKEKRELLIRVGASIKEYEEEMAPIAKDAAYSSLGIIIGMIGIVINTINIITSHKNKENAMRRDDAKRLIAALIRRRHNDALRIKKLRSRLNDGPREGLISKIEQLGRNLSQGLYEAAHYAKSASEKAALKAAESAIDNLSKAINNGRLERADSIVTNAFKTLKQAGAEVKTSNGKDGYMALKQLKNYINSLKKMSNKE